MIRPMQPSEYYLLSDFLYEAIFQKDEGHLAPKSIIEKPELQIYIKDFGKQKGDYCYCAEIEKKIIGAVWVRHIKGYGNVDEDTPEFAIALYKAYRGLGIGTKMMKIMIAHLKRVGYVKASLAVQKDNDALKMYQSVGFKIIDENEEEYIMICDLKE